MGDIVGDMYSHKWSDFRKGQVEEWDNKTDGHRGGDWNLMSDWIQAVAHQDESLLTSNISASIESHIMGFAAEKSRKSETVEKINL